MTADMTANSETARFKQAMEERARKVDIVLAQVLAGNPAPDEIARPERLLAAMRHAVMAGGKRFRPFLVIECAALFGYDPEKALLAAASVECLHTYSLVHDDLPCMDDDDLRRGQPTVHKAFDEATAILAGDGLLTLAFDCLSRPETHPDPAIRIELVACLARASGLGGMVGGQILDLMADINRPDEAGIRQLQAMKTGALISASCVMGAHLAGADSHNIQQIRAYGSKLGLAFQIADDLLDITGDANEIGKATGKDAAMHKATLVGCLGADAARQALQDAVGHCERLLEPYGSDAQLLRDAARFAANRTS